jgi:hypothetical protein
LTPWLSAHKTNDQMTPMCGAVLDPLLWIRDESLIIPYYFLFFVTTWLLDTSGWTIKS